MFAKLFCTFSSFSSPCSWLINKSCYFDLWKFNIFFLFARVSIFLLSIFCFLKSIISTVIDPEVKLKSCHNYLQCSIALDGFQWLSFNLQTLIWTFSVPSDLFQMNFQVDGPWFFLRFLRYITPIFLKMLFPFWLCFYLCCFFTNICLCLSKEKCLKYKRHSTNISLLKK